VLTPIRTRFAAGVALGLLLWFMPQAWRFAGQALSPFLAICSPISTRAVAAASLLALPMLALVVIRRRFWCRHLCPVGLISESCGKLRPAKPANRRGWPAGRYFALATFGGALAGYPLFLWLDPLALYAGFFGVFRLGGRETAVLSVAGLPMLMLASFLFPGRWCSRWCPLGATQDLLSPVFWRRGKQRRPAAPVASSVARRAIIVSGAGAALAAFPLRILAARRTQLRPPGAVDEPSFEGGCIRCGSCTRACPTHVIRSAVRESGGTGFLAPRLEFSENDYCRQDCNLCGQVCPTGVIRPLPLADKNRHTIGIAVVDLPDCYLTIEKECGICVARCPRAAIVDGFDRQSYTTIVQVIRDRCNGCGACVGICPPKVIRIEPV